MPTRNERLVWRNVSVLAGAAKKSLLRAQGLPHHPIQHSIGMNTKQKTQESIPLSTILQDREASIRLHKFLLGSFDEQPQTTIPAGGKTFHVQIIKMNPAPPIRRVATAKPQPSP